MSDLTRKYIADLDAGVRDLFNSERWKNYLDFFQFHRYSANNTIAIFLQRPTASLVASFSDWRRKGRQVRKGEHGIKILPLTPSRTWTTKQAKSSSASVSILPTALTSARPTAQTCRKAQRVN